MNVRNEIKAQIIRTGMTMQEVVDLLSQEYGWSDSVSTCPPSSSVRVSVTKRCWSLPTCWAMKSSGRNGGIPDGETSVCNSALAKYKGPEIGSIEAHDERTKEKYASNDI